MPQDVPESRRKHSVVMVVIGFLLTLTGIWPLIGVGFPLMWIGLANRLAGSRIVRLGGSFVVSFFLLFPGLLFISASHGTEVTSIFTGGGAIQIGQTWDEALPALNLGERVEFGFEDQDRAVEVRKFGGDSYRLTFERLPGGPLRIVRIVRQ